MIRSALPLTLALASAFVAPPVANADPFAVCESEFAARRGEWNGCGCFYSVGIGPGLLHEAASRVRAHLDIEPENPCLSFYLGRLRLLQGDEEAEPLLRAAAAGYARDGGPGGARGAVYAHINLSRLLHDRSRHQAAEDELAAARRVAASLGDEALGGQVDLQSARLQLSRGVDLESLARRLEEMASRPLAADPGSTFGRDALLALGNARYQLGRFAEAESAFHRMADMTRAAGDLYGEATAWQNRVIARMALGPQGSGEAGQVWRDELVGLQRQALDAAVAAEQRHAEAAARLRLGRLLRGTGSDGAEDELRRAEDLARELGDVDLQAQALAALAAATVARDPNEARRLADASWGRVRSAPLATSGGHGWAGRLEVAWRTLPRTEALAEADATIRWIESLRDRQSDEAGRARLFGVWTEVYSDLIGRLLDEERAGPEGPDPALAFELAERMRARVLRERLGTDQGVAGLDEVSRALGEDQALLLYQLAPWRDVYGDPAGGAWLLVVTRRRLHVHSLQNAPELEPGLRLFRHLFERRDGSEERSARQLSRELLEPALAELPPGVDRLVLVPDGVLYGLPFAALPALDGRPLVTRYELTLTPSATAWLQAAASRRDGAMAGRRVALADPHVPGPIGGGSGSDSSREALRPLPHARNEGRLAIRLLGGPGELLLGRDASESAVRALPAGQVDLLHFAAHAVLDAERPDRSAVVLAPDPEADGRLEPHEISALDLHGALVVLSACQSARGEPLPGEGPLSLARAFLAARASAVVASLWPLRDDEAARLFDAFYRHLARGQTAAQSLAAAQNDLRDSGEPAAAWAGVVLLGDGMVAVPTRPRPFPLARLALAAGGVGLLLLVLTLSILAAWTRTVFSGPSDD